MHLRFNVPADWYTTFFTAPVNHFWEMMISEEATQADIGFITRHIGQRPPARVLDIPSGAGRHAFALAEAGYDVLGIDISADAVARAKEAATRSCSPAQFLEGDMRTFEASEPADAAICFGNSAGYFGADGMADLFARFARNVRKGGRVIVDSYTCAESIFPLEQRRELDFCGGSYTSELRYDPLRSVLETEAVLRLGEERHELRYAHQVVTTGELARFLKAAGFETLAMYGDTDDKPYAVGSARLLLVAERH